MPFQISSFEIDYATGTYDDPNAVLAAEVATVEQVFVASGIFGTGVYPNWDISYNPTPLPTGIQLILSVFSTSTVISGNRF